MAEHLLIGILIGLASGIVALIVIAALTLRRLDEARATEATRMQRTLAEMQRSWAGTERSVRQDIAATRRELETATRDSRDESAHSARALRDEITGGLRGVTDSFVRGLEELTRLQKVQTDTLAQHVAHLTDAAVGALRDHPLPALSHLADAQERQLAAVAAELRHIQADHRDNLDQVRAEAVGHAKDLQNELVESLKAQLEDIRSSVDQKLETTLERRVEESFTLVSERLQLVSERLEQVHRGLADVQTFAAGLGNIQRALTNVRLGTSKTRGGQPVTPVEGAEGRARAARRKPRPIPDGDDAAADAEGAPGALRAQQ